jgi:hypothetical protein
MDEQQERAAISELLTPRGLGELAAHLSVERVRPHSRVWATEVLSRGGDARVEVLAFPIAEDSAARVDFEDERTALADLAAAGRPHPRDPRVLADARSDDIAVLVIVAAEDETLVRRATGLTPTDDELSGPLLYHPQLDRLFGGDYTHEVGGRSFRAALMSVARAERLYAAIVALGAAYRELAAVPEGDRLPFAEPAAVRELEAVPILIQGREVQVPVSDLLAQPALVRAPADYGRLAVMHSLLPAGEALGADPPRVADAVGLASPLSLIVGCGHRRAGVVFSRAHGCCLRPEFITAEGTITDLYFLTPAADLTSEEVHHAKMVDLTNLFSVLATVAASDRDRPLAISAALEGYALGDAPAPELLALASEIGADNARFAVLARATLADVAHEPRPDSRLGSA